MAITATALTAPMAFNDLTAFVTAVTGAVVNQPVKFDDEWAVVTEIISPSTIRVRSRGDRATTVKAHALGGLVIFCHASDIPDRAPLIYNQASVGADGAIAVPTRDAVAVLNKGSVGAYTMGAPSQAVDDVELTLVGGSAFAHVVTFTPAFFDATSGTNTLATSPAIVGASLTLKALNGAWHVKSNSGWVLTT